MLAKVNSCITVGVEGIALDIEVDISSGLPMFATVGLPDGAVRESKDRVKAAIRNCGYDFPNKRITVNLAPADLKKEGAGYDLPIALGILSANGLISQEQLNGFTFIGELSLDGSVRSVKGVLPMALCVRKKGINGIVVPRENGEEAGVVKGIDVYPVSSLSEVVDFLAGEKSLLPLQCRTISSSDIQINYGVDFSEVRGQNHAKRAFEIAAAGNHNIVMKGPPGSGKTMLARRLPTIMPHLTLDEALDTTKIHSVAGLLNGDSSLIVNRPFRAPHHTISDAGLIGGGSYPKPGEASLAHNGILFLDELTEFKKNILETLRQPLEDKNVTISRVNMSLCFPSNFLFVGAFNPCPCGFFGDKSKECSCTPQQVQKYTSKISGPLLDRVDIFIEVSSLQYKELSDKNEAEPSHSIRKRVLRARELQAKRFAGDKEVESNSMMTAKLVDQYCQVDKHAKMLLEKSLSQLGLSARGYHRILKLARTIADLEGEKQIGRQHVAEAIQYRRPIH